MKKYFMKGTDDELQFGDVIELDFIGEEEGVRKHTHLEMKFMPEYVEDLLEEDVIEERDAEDDEEDDLIDFEEDINQKIEFLEDEQVAFNKRVSKLEEKVATLEELFRLLKPEKDEKTSSSKKK